MKRFFFRFLVLLCFTLLISALPGTVRAEGLEATELSDHSMVKGYSGFGDALFVFNKDTVTYRVGAKNSALTLEHQEGMGSLYMIFGAPYQEYTIRDNTTGETAICGAYGFIHEFIDLEAIFGTAPTSVTIEFGDGQPKLSEIRAFSTGEVPSSIQKWEPHDGKKMDMLLFSTHADDEQLFFAGVLPYYSGELDYNVLVVYLTDHHNTDHFNNEVFRMHEALNGLWAVGVTTYPVFGEFLDLYALSKDELYWEFAKRGVTKEDFQAFVVEQIRRFKPLVALAQDFDGEYGHAQHKIYAEVVSEALTMTADASFFPESAEAYGTWDVPKAYFHLYPENPIVMDWDQPLESFDGRTAFEVTRDLGFVCHKSQYKLFCDLISYRLASVVERYNPCYYGLYRSLVGADVQKNDFFENLTTYAEDAAFAEAQKLAEEEAKRQAEEEARLKAEEEARQASEEAARQESIAQETTVPHSTEPAEAEDPIPSLLIRLWYVPAILAVLLIIGLILLCRKRPKK